MDYSNNYESWKQCRNLANHVAFSITQKKFELESSKKHFLELLDRTHNAWASMGIFFVEEPYRQKEKELAHAEQSLRLALKEYESVFDEYEALVQLTRMHCEEIERRCNNNV